MPHTATHIVATTYDTLNYATSAASYLWPPLPWHATHVSWHTAVVITTPPRRHTTLPAAITLAIEPRLLVYYVITNITNIIIGHLPHIPYQPLATHNYILPLLRHYMGY